jgi:hypothetical protein
MVQAHGPGFLGVNVAWLLLFDEAAPPSALGNQADRHQQPEEVVPVSVEVEVAVPA